MPPALTRLAAAQAVYFTVTGLWPIVHIRSFMAVTGLKIDLWLVKTVGALVTMIGIVVAAAAWRGIFSLELFLLAIGTPSALAFVDVYYVARRIIARIYLVDALAEILILAAWLILWRP